jgi:pimeloyl-ACP methyl ester carboxylesterase
MPNPDKPSAFEKALLELRQQPRSAYPNVSIRWLVGGIALTILGAAICGWLALCLLFWQGNWQLLYHPTAQIGRTPASLGIPFEPVKFAATETGVNQLTGWWLPSDSPAARTILYFHGADGNLSDSLDTLAALHRQHLAVFAVDYRGYGQSQPAVPHPTEKQLRQDAEWSLTWLTLTRNIPARQIVVAGTGLGATVAAQLAADHAELAGVILDQPVEAPMDVIFNDPRSRLLPARWLVHDRFDLIQPATALRIPILWLLAQSSLQPRAYAVVSAQKAAAWLIPPTTADPHFTETLRRWLDDLPGVTVGSGPN